MSGMHAEALVYDGTVDRHLGQDIDKGLVEQREAVEKVRKQELAMFNALDQKSNVT